MVCDKVVCVKFMVCDRVKGRRREEEKEKEPGIQNQKQEPHTKMWGKTQFLPVTSQVKVDVLK